MRPRDRKLLALQKLLDFHEQRNTDPSLAIHIALSPTELARLIGQVVSKDSPTEFIYRGRVVIATAPDPVAQRFLRGS